MRVNIISLFFEGCGKMKLTMKGKVLSVALALVASVLSAQASGASVAPLQQLKGTVEGILAVMQDEGLSAQTRRQERRNLIMALVDERFDFEEMSQRTLGKAWKELTEAERTQFQQLLADLLKNTYIDRIESYSDEKVEYAKEIFGRDKKDRAKVYTNILKNGQQIPINYSLSKKGEEWFVYDVDIEGVSLVRNYRTEFGRILNKEKFAGLVKRMQEKIESNEAKRNN